MAGTGEEVHCRKVFFLRRGAIFRGEDDRPGVRSEPGTLTLSSPMTSHSLGDSLEGEERLWGSSKPSGPSGKNQEQDLAALSGARQNR